MLSPAVFVFLIAICKYHMLDCFPFYEHFSRKEMLRVDAKQGAPRDGNSSLELFQVIISFGYFGV